jgi:hypothetical protein
LTGVISAPASVEVVIGTLAVCAIVPEAAGVWLATNQSGACGALPALVLAPGCTVAPNVLDCCAVCVVVPEALGCRAVRAVAADCTPAGDCSDAEASHAFFSVAMSIDGVVTADLPDALGVCCAACAVATDGEVAFCWAACCAACAGVA